MSFGVKLPIQYSSVDGFETVDTFKNTIKQNFKMLLLTNPGERIMIPEYGIGIKTYLFENYGAGVEGQIKTRIFNQVGLYMPVIKVGDIHILGLDADSNILSMKIYYSIPDLGVQDLLEFTI